jgi:subtilase family serine protease
VYDSYGYRGQQGWFRVGGTSLSAPLVAAAYALAGNGASTTYGSFPYSHTQGLFDVSCFGVGERRGRQSTGSRTNRTPVSALTRSSVARTSFSTSS